MHQFAPFSRVNLDWGQVLLLDWVVKEWDCCHLHFLFTSFFPIESAANVICKIWIEGLNFAFSWSK
jgi:hypothetical protein